ncbi:MAG TPA: hypothetical protein VFS63_10320 [Pseudolabrys sp.]|jgi:hypothetical protein|nr:hypothetical protein [Pseudolabrys sp.]
MPWWRFADAGRSGIVRRMTTFPPDADTEVLRRLHYAAAVACGVFAALVVHIVLTVFGIGLDAILRGSVDSRQQFIAALAWWAIGGAAFVAAWAAEAYLIAAARERQIIFRLAQWFLIVLVFAGATAGGILSKTGDVGGTINVIAGLIALALGLVCGFCGARLAYLNAEQA